MNPKIFKNNPGFIFKVNKDFVELQKETLEVHPKIAIIHGGAETEKKKPKPRVLIYKYIYLCYMICLQ